MMTLFMPGTRAFASTLAPLRVRTELMQLFAAGRDQLLKGECDAARKTTAKVADL